MSDRDRSVGIDVGLIERLILAAHQIADANAFDPILQVALEALLDSTFTLLDSRIKHVDNVVILKVSAGRLPSSRELSLIGIWDRHSENRQIAEQRARYAFFGEPLLDSLAKGMLLTIDDTAEFAADPRCRPADNLAFHDAKIGACAAIPMMAQDAWIGLVVIGCASPHQFLSDEIDLYRTLAGEISSALVDDTLRSRASSGKVDYLSRLVQQVGHSIITTNPSGEITGCNMAAEMLYGYSAAELIGQRFSTLAEANGKIESDLWLRTVVQDSRVLEVDTQAMDHQQRVFECHLTLSPLQDSEKQVVGVAIVAVDTGGKAALHKTLQDERDLLEAILETTNDAIIMVDAERRIMTANLQFETFFQVPRYDFLRQQVDVLTTWIREQSNLPGELSNILLAFAGDRFQSGAGELELLSLPARTLVWYSTPVYAHDGTNLGRLFVFRDVTSEREADRMKTEFISLISHELRTPMTSIKGFSDLILDGDAGQVNALVREYLEIIKVNADRMICLINDILDVTRIEIGRISLHRTECQIADLINSVVQSFFPQIDKSRQQLEVHIDPDLPSVLVDNERIAQVIGNLLGNATKHTLPDGELGIEARCVKTADDLPQDAPPGLTMPAILVGVHDTGIGIAPQDQAFIFTQFYRAERATDLQIPGTGLGLAIARSVVELHGGHVWVQSVLDKGSSFYFTIPLTENR